MDVREDDKGEEKKSVAVSERRTGLEAPPPQVISCAREKEGAA